MLDKQLANRLIPLVNNPEMWEPLKEHLQNLRMLELQALAMETSEPDLFRRQGKASSLANLLTLKEQVIQRRKDNDDG
jgi:hypothetical protein